MRFGDASADLTKQHLKRLAPLPDDQDPVAIYLGPGPDKTLRGVPGRLERDAPGRRQLQAVAADCETVTLHEGDTEFFDVKDATRAP